jgi:hypothetical protein
MLLPSVIAQPADPVSGNWGSDGATFLELKFDGKRTVTGTAIWRGGGQTVRTPIKNGTFDVKTRALKLEGEGKRPDGVSGTYVIEGIIDGGKTWERNHLQIEARRIDRRARSAPRTAKEQEYGRDGPLTYPPGVH